MREQSDGLEWYILSCQRSLRLWWGYTMDLCCHLFAVVVDVVTELARQDEISELLYSDDLVSMSETIEGLRNKFRK